MKQTIKDEKLKDKISEDDRKKVQDKCTEPLVWLDANQTADQAEFEQHQKEVECVCNPIVTKLYASGRSSGRHAWSRPWWTVRRWSYHRGS
ncbi:HSP70-1 protein [Aphelenchoides avenae]|nr:HSP70-1 protein [Aphelenchus avenae]